MICKNCRHEVGNAAYCPYCGKAVSPDYPTFLSSPSETEKKPRIGLIIAVCVAVAAVIAAVVLLIVLLGKNADKNADASSDNSSAAADIPEETATENFDELSKKAQVSSELLIKTDSTASWSDKAAFARNNGSDITDINLLPAITSTDDTSKWHSIYADDKDSSVANPEEKWAEVEVHHHESGAGVYMETISLKMADDSSGSEQVYLTKAELDADGPMAGAINIMLTTSDGTPVCTIGAEEIAPSIWNTPITDDVTVYTDPPAPFIPHKQANTFDSVSDGIEIGSLDSPDSQIDLKMYVWIDGQNSSVYTDNSDYSEILLSLFLQFAASSGDSGSSDDSAGSPPEDAEPVTNSGGRIVSYYKNEYDDEGRLIRTYDYDKYGYLIGSTGYEYDEYGNDIKTIMYDKDGHIAGQIKYEKTPEGLETKRTELDADDRITSIVTTEYTDGDLVKSVHQYKGDGTLKGYEEYEYENRVLSKVTYYDAHGSVKRYTTYEYGDNGDVVETKYDAHGNRINR